MSTNPRAPADSPCELLPCPFCGSSTRDECACMGERDGEPWTYIECEACGAIADSEFWNRRAPHAPPVLSARPNEAECPYCNGYGQIPIDDGYVGDHGCTNACSPPEPPTMAVCEECFGSGKVPKNEADAPRGQAEVYDALGDGYRFVLAFITEFESHRITNTRSSNFDATGWLYKGAVLLRDKHKKAYCTPPPSPVGEADGVLEDCAK